MTRLRQEAVKFIIVPVWELRQRKSGQEGVIGSKDLGATIGEERFRMVDYEGTIRK